VTMEQRVQNLRQEFDRTFSIPREERRESFEDFIAVRVAGDPYLLRLADLAALAARRTIVPLPSRRPECLGLIGHQGAPAALFSLRLLLGYGASASPPRWMAVLRDAAATALAFDEYEGFARIPESEIRPLGPAAQRRFVSRGARHGEQLRLVVDVPAIVKTLGDSQR